jgi:hypothetical protein
VAADGSTMSGAATSFDGVALLNGLEGEVTGRISY